MYVYLYILMHDHVYSAHHLFSSFSKELYRLAVKSLLFKLINNATYVYAIVILYDQSQIHLSRGRGLQMGWVFNKEVYARLQTRNLILIFCFMYLSPLSHLSKNLNNTQKMFYISDMKCKM